ncbi:Sodium-dependent nutrient amino acid transporter 1 [Chionoecetes opilio]|uniref:Sodium-dependent nutrient amino acid transporter 1 n=1 Tax=Chionoecetes opilio TaxID=41210 RepID=A0A8J4XMA3_CHIOP|nr:Sodium-dependent nutrient amino acid transporter 1 [Chionoecetes opilio]
MLSIFDTFHQAAEDGEEEQEEERQQWSHPIEFLLFCIAMSVGLGNVWRFPTTAFENGGGAFLIPYLVVLVFIGRPLYFLELALGQFSSSSCTKIWLLAPALKDTYQATHLCWCIGILFYPHRNRLWPANRYLVCADVLLFFDGGDGVLLRHVLQYGSPVVCVYDAWADENCVDASSTNVTYNNKSQSSSEQYY